MEGKLFIVGLAMGAYALGTKYYIKTKAFEKPLKAVLWNALFWAFVFFITMMVFILSSQGRNPVTTVYSITKFQLIIWVAGTIAGAIWGFFKHRKDDSAKMAEVIKENLEWSETLTSAILLAAVVMFFFVQAFKIPSASMRSTLEEGDHLFVNKIKYGLHVPFTDKRIAKINKVDKEDVIVFGFPSANPAEIHCGGVQYSKEFIKRVVGLPGDTVEIREGVLLVNGRPNQNEESYAQYKDGNRIPPPAVEESSAAYQSLWESRELGRKYGERVRDNFGPVTVPPASYFVMGDNRDHSCDSRFWGPVPDGNIKGSGWFIYWPPARMRGIR
ncbi:MAG: signal peptidase I [Elusimicrobiaceae bacterium]|jgi:signal peptidase I